MAVYKNQLEAFDCWFKIQMEQPGMGQWYLVNDYAKGKFNLCIGLVVVESYTYEFIEECPKLAREVIRETMSLAL